MTTSIVNIKNKPRPDFDIYIGRANRFLELPESKFCNRFPLKRETDRPRILCLCRDDFLSRSEVIESLHELDDLILGCYCKPKICHGDLLVELRILQKCDGLQRVASGWRITTLDPLPDTAVLKFLAEYDAQ